MGGSPCQEPPLLPRSTQQIWIERHRLLPFGSVTQPSCVRTRRHCIRQVQKRPNSSSQNKLSSIRTHTCKFAIENFDKCNKANSIKHCQNNGNVSPHVHTVFYDNMYISFDRLYNKMT